jgi:hypothetical protein
MDFPLLISILLNATGTIIAIYGAIYNALGFHRFALALWIVSNLILMALFVGIGLGILVLNGGVWLTVLLYFVFTITSSYGYYIHSK